MFYWGYNNYNSKLAILSSIKILNKKNNYKMWDKNLLSIIFQMGDFTIKHVNPFPLIEEKIDKSINNSLFHVSIILEYLKRFKNNRYLIDDNNLYGIKKQYSSIIEFISWAIVDIPFKKEEILYNLIIEYVDCLSRWNIIHENNITELRLKTDLLIGDTEAFLTSSWYLFRYPNWKENHKYIVEYTHKRLGSSYFL